MSRTAVFDELAIDRAREVVCQAESARELRLGLSVILSVRCHVPNREISDMLGVGIATVSRLQKEIRNQVSGKKSEKKQWGGRRRETMSYEDELVFLGPWEQQAEIGGVLVVPPIHVALQERVGHPVAASTVYRMLARHGWRKVAPDTCHPKRDPEAQEAFKKGALRRNWLKL
jgi:transposase